MAFAYGSGVFKQTGNVSKNNVTDFVLVVEDSADWHRENLTKNPSDYTGILRLCGANAIADLQDKVGAKLFFNTLIPFEDGLIKYGVINRSSLIADLLDWECLYAAGRLQKPVRFVEKDSSARDHELNLGLRMNLKNALHTAMLLLPERFTEERLYHTLCGLSYTGDFRMVVGGEDKDKVSKIASGSLPHLQELYSAELARMNEYLLVSGEYSNEEGSITLKEFHQDMSPRGRHFHLTMLPKNMQEFLVREWNRDGRWYDVEDVLRSVAYDRDCDKLIESCLKFIVMQPAIVQAAKGILTAGPTKTIRYSSKKVMKMLKSRLKSIEGSPA